MSRDTLSMEEPKMIRLDLLSRAFGACMVVAMLTACGGSQAPPLVAVHSQSDRGISLHSKLSGETLTATKIRLYFPYKVCQVFGIDIVGFVVSGTAAGPYPGTFTAKGRWGAKPDTYRSPGSTGFGERFTIKSGSASYSGNVDYNVQGHTYGNCQGISLGQARYWSGALGAKGTATVQISRGSFQEGFQ